MLNRFRSLVGQPNRVYLTGSSMGGHVTGVAIEQWPNSFDGAQPECGVMGDNELFDFFQDAYLVAETVVGDPPAVPTPDNYFTSPDGWAATRSRLGATFPTNLTPAGERFKAIVEQLTGGDRPAFDTGFAGPVGGAFIFNFGSATTGPGRDNIGTTYQFDQDPALSAAEQAFNDQIVRIAADPQYRHRNGLGRLPGSDVVSPPISGDISIPVLSTHTIGELFVPFHMEQIYAAAGGRARQVGPPRDARDPRHRALLVPAAGTDRRVRRPGDLGDDPGPPRWRRRARPGQGLRPKLRLPVHSPGPRVPARLPVGRRERAVSSTATVLMSCRAGLAGSQRVGNSSSGRKP